MIVRPEAQGDAVGIDRVVASAFDTRAETDLVRDLRRGGDLVLSLVAEEDGALIGHVAFSRLTLDPPGPTATALAPVAVSPEHQRKGIGGELIRKGLDALREKGERLVLVLGEPDYYRRFGFSAEAVKDLRTPWDGPYMMALWLDRPAAGTRAVRYASAFDRLG